MKQVGAPPSSRSAQLGLVASQTGGRLFGMQFGETWVRVIRIDKGCSGARSWAP